MFESCSKFLNIAKKNYDYSLTLGSVSPDEWFEQIINQKTKQRLEQFAKETHYDITRNIKFNGDSFLSLKDLTYHLLSLVRKTEDKDMSFVHGDFFFGNILFDNTAKRIKLIDPRGMIDHEKFSVYGDIRYEIAKLTHSVVGKYDEIIADRGSFKTNDNYDFVMNFRDEKGLTQNIVDSFINKDFLGYNVDSKENYALTCLLFISMLPLHNEDEQRQKKFIANVYRLYSKFIKE